MVFTCFSANLLLRYLGILLRLSGIFPKFSEIFPKFPEILPGFLTNQNFLGCACTPCIPTSYTTGLAVFGLFSGQDLAPWQKVDLASLISLVA